MSEERLATIEQRMKDFARTMTTVMNTLNATVENDQQPPPRGRAQQGRGRGGGRGHFLGFREREQDEPLEEFNSDSEESMVGALQGNHNKDLKVEIPDFVGSLNPEDLLDWIRVIERVFEFKGYSDARSFKVATLKLKGYSSLWYENLKNQRRREGKEPIKSWSKLKKKLKERFIPRDYTQDYIRLTQLKQDQQPLESYLRDFEQITLQCEMNEKPEQKIARFVEGLDTHLANRVRMQQVWSFDEAVNLALRVEKMGKGCASNSKLTTKTVPSKPSFGVTPNEPTPTTKTNTLDKGKTVETTTAKRTVPLKKCYQCQGYGHFAKECPSTRALSTLEVVQWGEDEILVYEEEEEVKESEEIDIVMPDAGLSLVTWRVMHTHHQPLETDQRQQIFRSRCTIKGRVCNLIIDRGSCTNVASSTLIEKLSLPTLDHPNPYKLRWLNKGVEVRVDKQSLVPFSIGKNYVDEALCDILPMDACHLLLGRPWEYDRDSVHHGKDNTYTFKFGSRKIILSPLPPTLKLSPTPSMLESSKEVLMINEAEMMQDLKGNEDVYLLVVRNVNEKQGYGLPLEVQPLLESYGDVFPSELPSGLPPLRGIEHQIDFVPGATLPNKAAYRSDPKATQELHTKLKIL
ncbi:hypothetical protein RND81_07G006900 [Saponaria officinalis]|uniref:CCHC-type domain-containing protein n=1 Tax=Saponaria officinalis TaxID=3572 RepID=A0AAW1JKP2_SAPOF